MIVNDKELADLNYKKHELLRDRDKKYITKEDFIQRFKVLNDTINEKVRLLIESTAKKEKQIEEERLKMEDEQPVQVEVKPKGRKVSGNSYASVIGKVLEMKNISTLDEAVAKVDELKPGREKSKNVTQIKTVIRLAKAGIGRWAEYTWNEETFLLVPKE